MSTVELDSFYLACTVGSYIVNEKLLSDSESGTWRLEKIQSMQQDGSKVRMTLGIGTFPFVFEDNELVYTRVSLGEPVTGRSCEKEAVVMEKVTICGEKGSEAVIQRLCSFAVDAEDADVDDFYQTFVWDAQSDFWRRMAFSHTRDMSTIVLDAKIATQINEDLDDFTAKETMEWYRNHSIPFKRGYLLYGPPGTGKTSMISAFATRLRRNVHRISMVAPKLCDDSLHSAISSLRKPSIIVMEDIDSLFNRHREKKEEFCVTFSGLLNAIDGLGDNTNGSLFVFTTNHPENLDPALCRKGRIDRKFNLGYVTHQVCIDMFMRFYPGEHDFANAFAKNVQKTNKKVTAAELQEHFISHRKVSAENATDFTPSDDDSDYSFCMWS